MSVTAPVGLSQAFVLDGGRAVAETRVLPDGREAVSTVDASLELGGVVRLDSMRRTAGHHTGDADDLGGTFSIGALELLGVPIPGVAFTLGFGSQGCWAASARARRSATAWPRPSGSR